MADQAVNIACARPPKQCATSTALTHHDLKFMSRSCLRPLRTAARVDAAVAKLHSCRPRRAYARGVAQVCHAQHQMRKTVHINKQC